MTDYDIVRRFADVVFFGSLYGPYSYRFKDGHKRKPFLYWTADGDDGFSVAAQLWPWLGPRRRAQVVEVYGEAPPQPNHVKSAVA